MKFDPDRHHRQSTRLRGFDYAQAGAYFVTIGVQDRACLFGDVVAGALRLNDAGRMVLAEWLALPNRFPCIHVDAVVVMPNHLHGIVMIESKSRAATRAAPTKTSCDANPASFVGAPLVGALPVTASCDVDASAPTLGEVVGAFKSLTTLRYTQGVDAQHWPGFRGRLWQRGFHDEIVRGEPGLAQIRRYIEDNPGQWASDREHPAFDDASVHGRVAS